MVLIFWYIIGLNDIEKDSSLAISYETWELILYM